MSHPLRRVVSLLVVGALGVTGCSESGSPLGPADTSSAATTISGGDGSAVPEVLVQPYTQAAVSQTMGPDGIDITVESPNVYPGADSNATLQLAMPSDSVPSGTEVTVTPLTAVKVGDRTWRVVAGATFEPDGTTLASTGGLRITLPLPTAVQMGLITWGAGEVQTVRVSPGQTEVRAAVDHFSGAALVSDPAGEADDGISRDALMALLGNDKALTGASTEALALLNEASALLNDAKLRNFFGDESGQTMLDGIIQSIETELDRMAATCPKDVKALKTAMKRIIELYSVKGIVLLHWDAARVDDALSECDRYTVVFEARLVAMGLGLTQTQTLSGTAVATVIDDETTYGEGILYSKLVGTGLFDWNGEMLRLVNTARAENGVAPCTAHDVPGRIEVSALDVSLGDVLLHVSLNLYDAIHDWGGSFGCESLDGGLALFADVVTAFGKTNPIDFSLNERAQGWDGHPELSGSAEGASIEVDMRVAVLRTPGAPLTKGGPKGPAVGVGRPTYDHYEIYNDDENRVVVTAWDSSTGASVTFYPEFDSTDEYAGMDGGWDGESTVPTDNPFEGDGGDAPRADDAYWEEPWDPFEEINGDDGGLITDDTVTDDTIDDGGGGGTDDTVDDGGGSPVDTDPPVTDPPDE